MTQRRKSLIRKFSKKCDGDNDLFKQPTKETGCVARAISVYSQSTLITRHPDSWKKVIYFDHMISTRGGIIAACLSRWLRVFVMGKVYKIICCKVIDNGIHIIMIRTDVAQEIYLGATLSYNPTCCWWYSNYRKFLKTGLIQEGKSMKIFKYFSHELSPTHIDCLTQYLVILILISHLIYLMFIFSLFANVILTASILIWI